MDSGCNSLLLPLDDAKLQYLETSFASSKYHWTVEYSSGVGISTPKLLIKDQTNNLEIHLLKGTHDFKKKLKCLRFFVALADVDILLKSKNLAEKHISLLMNFKKMAMSINSVCPELKFGQRRKHALLGQEIYFEYCVIQFDELMIVLKWENFLSSTTEKIGILFNTLNDISEECIKPFRKEFMDLEDEEHDISKWDGAFVIKEHLEG